MGLVICSSLNTMVISLALIIALTLTCWSISSHLKHCILSFQPFLAVLRPIPSNFRPSPMVDNWRLSVVGTKAFLFEVTCGASFSSASFHTVVVLSLVFNVSLSRTCYGAYSCVGFKPLWNMLGNSQLDFYDHVSVFVYLASPGHVTWKLCSPCCPGDLNPTCSLL